MYLLLFYCGREEDEEDYEERIEQQLAKQEEDLDKIKEESRKRRQAILEKYRQQQQKHVESPSNNYPEGNFSLCYCNFLFCLKELSSSFIYFFSFFLLDFCPLFYMFICCL